MICGAECDNQQTVMVDVASNYRGVVARIRKTAAGCGRNPAEIKILAASKSQDISQIRAAIAAGIQLFGENYVQEAQKKKYTLNEAVQWHMIGHLQRNKAKLALELFDLIESLDNLELAKELNRQATSTGKVVRTYVEVNLTGEKTKSGIAEDKMPWLLEGIGSLSHVQVEGFMTIPPFRENPEEVRPYFRSLRLLKEKFSRVPFRNISVRELSMGMTHDYPVAIEEGATLVRIGTGIFGPREI